MQLTNNYQLKKPDGTDVVNIDDFNNNADIIDNALKAHDTQLSDFVYQTAGGTGTALTVTIKGTLVNGYPITFIESANNGGAATTINGKKLYKPGTTTAPNLIAGKAYTVWYNQAGDCFFIKASAEGDAVAANVLAGKKFSNDNDTGLVGTLDLSNLVSGNIKSGVTINGVSGKSSVVDTADSNAVAGQILNGQTAYVNGNKIVGNIPTIGYANIPTSCGQWANGDLAVYLANSGYYIAGAGGSEVRVPVAQLQNADTDLIAQNIVAGKSIFGIAGNASIGSLGGMKFASGIITNVQRDTSVAGSNYYGVVSGLTFTPSIIIVYFGGISPEYPNPWTGTYCSQLTGNSYTLTQMFTSYPNFNTRNYTLNNSNVYYGGFNIPILTGYYTISPWKYIAIGN
jgi:hypothetical protein